MSYENHRKNFFLTLSDNTILHILGFIDFDWQLLYILSLVNKSFHEKIGLYFEGLFLRHFPNQQVSSHPSWLKTYNNFYLTEYVDHFYIDGEENKESFSKALKQLFTFTKEGRIDLIEKLLQSDRVFSDDFFKQDIRGYTVLSWAGLCRDKDTRRKIIGCFFEFLNAHKSAITWDEDTIHYEIQNSGSLETFEKLLPLYREFLENSGTKKLDIFKEIYLFLYMSIAYQRLEIIHYILSILKDNNKFEHFTEWLLNLYNDNSNEFLFTTATDSHQEVFSFCKANIIYDCFSYYANACLHYTMSRYKDYKEKESFPVIEFILKQIKENELCHSFYFQLQQENTDAVKNCINILLNAWEKNPAHANILKQYLSLLVLNKTLPSSIYNEFGLVNIAVKIGDKPLLEKMLENGANPNLGSRMKVTPLLRAINMKRNDLAICLLLYGADPNIPNKYGISPMIRAMQIGKNDFYYMNDKNHNSQTLLEWLENKKIREEDKMDIDYSPTRSPNV